MKVILYDGAEVIPADRITFRRCQGGSVYLHIVLDGWVRVEPLCDVTSIIDAQTYDNLHAEPVNP